MLTTNSLAICGNRISVWLIRKDNLFSRINVTAWNYYHWDKHFLRNFIAKEISMWPEILITHGIAKHPVSAYTFSVILSVLSNCTPLLL